MRVVALGFIAFLHLAASGEEILVKPRPDFVVYRPSGWDGLDATNEHFLVTPTKSGDFLAVWTQAKKENGPDQRIVMSRSRDEGKTWSAPQVIAGDPAGKTGRLASWAFPFMVPDTGRIYLFWNQNVGVVDAREDTTGTLTYIWSDDNGETWSGRHTLDIRKSRISHPTADAPANFVIFQPPVITSAGGAGRLHPLGEQSVSTRRRLVRTTV